MRITMRVALASMFAALSCLAQEGSQVYISHCIECHSPASASHAPSQEALSQIPWQDILKTLETGAMTIQAQNLTQEERIAAARYLGKAGGAPVLPQVTGFCPAGSRPTVIALRRWAAATPTCCAPTPSIDLTPHASTRSITWPLGPKRGTSACATPASSGSTTSSSTRRCSAGGRGRSRKPS